MVRKTIVWLLFVSLICGFFGSGVSLAQMKQNTNEQAGYALLDRLIYLFQDLASSGTGGEGEVNKGLDRIMAVAKKDYVEKRIDPVFFKGFQHILMIIKLVVYEDVEGILGPLVQKEVGDYILKTTGEEVDLTNKKGIGSVAMAIAQGIINLHLYLDTKPERDRIWSEIERKIEAKQPNTSLIGTMKKSDKIPIV